MRVSDAEFKGWPWVFAVAKRVRAEAMRKIVRKKNRITKPKPRHKGLRQVNVEWRHSREPGQLHSQNAQEEARDNQDAMFSQTNFVGGFHYPKCMRVNLGADVPLWWMGQCRLLRILKLISLCLGPAFKHYFANAWIKLRPFVLGRLFMSFLGQDSPRRQPLIDYLKNTEELESQISKLAMFLLAARATTKVTRAVDGRCKNFTKSSTMIVIQNRPSTLNDWLSADFMHACANADTLHTEFASGCLSSNSRCNTYCSFWIVFLSFFPSP